MAVVNILFMTFLALFSMAVISWGARTLPGEKWQIMATVPGNKGTDGSWSGCNLTYYGVIVAGAYTISAAIFLILMSTVGASMPIIVVTAGIILAVCAPASRIMARVVEKKKHTFSVGGASFVGLLIAPWMFYAVIIAAGSAFGSTKSAVVPMAVLAIAFAFGEGFGRLACVSFGCCYGRRVEDLPAGWRKLFRRFHIVFIGRTKKVAYAHGWEGQPLIPVQLITSILYVAAGLAGTGFFLSGMAGPAFLIPLAVTQLWRVMSEFLRADYRGESRHLTAYQMMALAAIPYGILVTGLFATPGSFQPDIVAGLAALWHPGVLLSLQVLWLLIFMQTGRSMVTGSRMTFFFHPDRI